MAERPTEPATPPTNAVSRRDFLQAAGAAGAGFALGDPTPALAQVAAAVPGAHARSDFDVAFEKGAIVSLRRMNDAFDTNYVQTGGRVGDVVLRYRRGAGDWQTADTSMLAKEGQLTERVNGDARETRFVVSESGTPVLDVSVGFVVEAEKIRWTIGVANRTAEPLEIGDFSVPLPMNTNFRQPGRPSTAAVLKHSFISGDASFLFWMRNNSVGPYLTMTPQPGTRLEYWEAQGGYRVFVHSAAAGVIARERGCKWRQAHTTATLAPAGKSGATRSYGFTLRWAPDYDGVRRILVDEGGVDVHVVPGMTVPTDLVARFALRTNHQIRGVDAEFPRETAIRSLGSKDGASLYEVRFQRLGENRLTVRYGDGKQLHLEWFSTEPIETLIRKRGAFIAKQQIRDPDKWYDGLLAEWNMDSRVQLSPDNYDRIKGWRIYAVTCDDPGLSKPAFLAAKQTVYPEQAEVGALDYYIERFVWGGLQRTSDETYAYGIYGIPDWKQNRDSADPGRNGRMHIWRIYDYPHLVLMYLSLYRVAKHQPHIRTALDAREYLRRAFNTAVAMFTIPTEVERWSAYRTGLYNELVFVDVIDALESEGLRDDADRLRMHWERKVQFFINENPNLFQSEYAFDSTGFESTHALASYAVRHARQLARERPQNDKFPPILPDATRRFMEVQMAANLFCRGSIEPAYYYLGSDYRGSAGNAYTLTYMSQMSGWAVLDYALHHAANPHPYLRLGGASYLSAWALMNTGTRESNYGYWYPGAENDGGAGGGFEPAPFGNTWLEQPHTRGSWYYSCEIDLGFCGALRGAATVLADDPIFGRCCHLGELRQTRGRSDVIPRDGLRRRFHAVLSAGRLHIELDVDRFAADRAIEVADDLSRVDFTLESDEPTAHRARLRFAASAGSYSMKTSGTFTDLVVDASGWAAVEVPVPANAVGATVSIVRRD